MFDPHFPSQFQDFGFIVNSIKGGSFAGIFLLAAVVGYILPFPEAIMLLLFGYISRKTGLNLTLVFLAASAGAIVGDNIVYRLSFFGNKYVERFNQKMRKNKLIQYEHLVVNNIGTTIYFLRFITGVRFFGPIISGTLGVRWKKFFYLNAQATLLHTMFFVLLGYFFRGKIMALIAEVEIIRNVFLFSSTLIVGILVSIFARKKIVKEKTDHE